MRRWFCHLTTRAATAAASKIDKAITPAAQFSSIRRRLRAGSACCTATGVALAPTGRARNVRV